MRSNLLVFWPKLLDVDQFAFLLVVAHRVFTGQLLAAFFVIVARMTPHPHLVGVAARLEAGIVKFPAAIKHPLQFFSCSFVRRDAILVGFDAHETRFCERDTTASRPLSYSTVTV